MAIFRTVLVFNSPSTLYFYLCNIISIIYNLPFKSRASRACQRTQAILAVAPTFFQCGCEYAFFLAFTFICIASQITLHVAWCPIIGLQWWYIFFRNLLYDPGGRSIWQIFCDPNPIAFFPDNSDVVDQIINSCAADIPIATPLTRGRLNVRINRLPRKRKRRKARLKPTTQRQQTISHFPRELTMPPFTFAISSFIHHMWHDHRNASMFSEINVILLSLWLMVGYRALKLCRIISSAGKSKLFTTYSHIASNKMAFTSVFNVDEKVKQCANNSLFDTDASFIVCDNSANTHICNNRDMFLSFRPISNGMVATIGGKLNRPSGIGTVKWIWKDDSGVPHTQELKDVLYFPKSPINIMSVTEFAKQLNDSEGTGIDTKMRYSRLYWDHNKFSRTIHHSGSNLPELAINEGNVRFSWWTKAFSRRVDDAVKPTCCFTSRDFDDHCCATIDKDKEATDSLFVESIIYPGEDLIYKYQGQNAVVKVESSKVNDKGMLTYNVKFPSGESKEVTREFLSRPDNPDIAELPTSIPAMKEAVRQLNAEQIESLAKPVAMSPLEQEFLDLHHRLLHLPYSVMFRLAAAGFLPKRFLRLKSRPPPCASCLFGTQHRSNWRSKTSKHGSVSSLRKEDLCRPGQCVGVDQMISAQPGLVPQEKGHMTRARIWACTIFIDYFTGYTYVALMRDLTAESTLAAKKEFEHRCAVRNITVEHYHADNGRFAEPAFVNECKRCNQKLTFCGVGAHHQNGIAERKIKDVTLIGRTILIHAMRYWPEYITIMFWPFAAKCAEERMNNLTINLDHETPDMRFSKSKAVNVQLKHYHTFGCPVYILDSRLQSNPKGVPKWEPRSRLGIYVGHSPAHAGSVALVLNPKTGLVSPQYHVVYDDNFTTVPHMRALSVPSNWAALVKNSSELVTTEQYDLTKTWFAGSSDPSADEILETPSPLDPVVVLEGEIERTQAATASNEGDPMSATAANEGDHSNPSTSDTSQPPSSDSTTVPEGDELGMPEMVNLEESGLRRSPRIAAQKNLSILTTLLCFSAALTGAIHKAPSVAYTTAESTIHRFNQANENFDSTCNGILHHVYSVGKEANENFTFKEMLQQDDKEEFVEAMKKEISDHTKREHWELVLRSDKPKDVKTIMAIWSFKRKRFPDGSLNKHKARLCAHGGQQQWGINYWETYAPVVNWISVRFLLIIAQLGGLKTQALDFVLAFPQAELDVPVYMEIPAGIDLGPEIEKRAYCILLKSSLYGLKQASSNWYECLKKGLERRGFKESVADPCVFMKKGMMVLVYVDDCILISKEKSMLDQFIHSLANGIEKFEFTDEGSMDKYLGVEIEQLNGNEFILRQPYLIQRILDFLNVAPESYNKRDVPVIGPLLGRDESGPDRKHEWHYRSAIGMLGYLQTSTRPDISMAVHQCARFNACPKLCHEKAIKYIARYLLSTHDKGIHYKPDPTRGLECFVDADFAGGWASGEHTNPECVLSRTGFVIMYAGCPLTWSSKLQTEIALSTTESEYIALSQAMRETIPFMNLMMEVGKIFPLHNPVPKFHCKVFEDNRSCIKVAESPKFTPRTKHIAIKYHHFRSYVADGTIKIYPVESKNQLADIFTKPLDKTIFCDLRRRLMGW